MNMDAKEQAAGERRVRDLLIDPLKQRGLAKPGTLNKADFEQMLDGLCQRMAYLTDASLRALEEVCASNPGGAGKDRFPIANDILKWAAEIQPPGDDASPLIRAVFGHALGQEALDGGWGPELLEELRRNRRWPGSYAVSQVRQRAHEAVRRMDRLREELYRGAELSPDDGRWYDRRRAANEKCDQIARLAREGADHERA